MIDAFRARSSPESDAAREQLLLDCVDDEALSQIAVAAQAWGSGAWLNEQTERLVREELLPRRALGLALAGFSHLTGEKFEVLVEAARVERTWVGDLVPHYRLAHRQDAWAKHWYRRFLAEEAADLWWPALQAFLGCTDARFVVWRAEAEGGEVADLDRKRRHLAVNRARLREALDRSKERKKTYLGVKVEQGEVAPFLV